MKMIKDIQRQSLYLGIGMALITLIISFDILMAISVLLGVIACNTSFILNIKSLDISESRDRVFKGLTSYILRILIYALAMVASYYLVGNIGFILSFMGCLSIRIIILIFGIRGGMNDGYIQ